MSVRETRKTITRIAQRGFAKKGEEREALQRIHSIVTDDEEWEEECEEGEDDDEDEEDEDEDEDDGGGFLSTVIDLLPDSEE